jgi:hypothetical protein
MQIIGTEAGQIRNFKNRFELMEYLMVRTMNLRKCFTFMARETEHLFLKCPVVGDAIGINGTEEEISYVFNQIVKKDLWKPGQLTGWN